MNQHKHWEIFEELPPGWVIDKAAGSPLAGHVFCHNGKSVLRGQKRALLKIQKKELAMDYRQPVKAHEDPHQKIETVIDGDYLKTVNHLARTKFKHKLLADIRADLMVCEIEGWSKTQYINELKILINSIGKNI